jgi:hypothetical protein
MRYLVGVVGAGHQVKQQGHGVAGGHWDLALLGAYKCRFTPPLLVGYKDRNTALEMESIHQRGRILYWFMRHMIETYPRGGGRGGQCGCCSCRIHKAAHEVLISTNEMAKVAYDGGQTMNPMRPM